MVRVKVIRIALYALAQRSFRFNRRSGTDRETAFPRETVSFASRFAGSHNCVGTVTTEICGVGNSGDCELRLIKELRLPSSSGLRWRGLCRLQGQVDVFDFFRTKKKRRDFGGTVPDISARRA